MTLQLLCGMLWPRLCPHIVTLLNFQKGFISGTVRSLLQALTYYQWYTGLPMVKLVRQVTRVYLILSPEPILQPSSDLTANQSAANLTTVGGKTGME